MSEAAYDLRPGEQLMPRPRLRDALTGEVLVDAHGNESPRCGPYVYRLPRDFRPNFTPTGEQRASDFDPEALMTHTPTALHTSQETTDGLLGAKRWSNTFRRYIETALPVLVAEADREDLHEWWRSPYARARVRRGFRAHYAGRPDADKRAETAASAALAVLRDPECADAILEDFARSPGWLKRQIQLAYRFAFQRSAHADIPEPPEPSADADAAAAA